jgi:hypothetical protein
VDNKQFENFHEVWGCLQKKGLPQKAVLLPQNASVIQMTVY